MFRLENYLFNNILHMPNRKLFIPTNPYINLPGQTMAKGPKLSVNSAISGVTAAYDKLPPAVQTMVREKGVNLITNVTNKGNNNNNRRRGGNGGGGSSNSPNPSSNSNGNTSFSLTKAPDPRDISLSSPVDPQTYSSDFMTATEGVCSPTHFASGLFQIPTSAASRLYNYFNQIIAFEVQIKAQANVGFNLNINTNFTAAKILTAFNSVFKALQVYLYYASIIAYHSDYKNQNEGMLYVRNNITPDMIEGLTRLNRKLSFCPIPPRILDLLYYLSGNFTSGNTSGASIIKIVPTIPLSNMVIPADITGAISLLEDDNTEDVMNLMRRCIPQWILGDLKDVPTTPFYDPQFLTIFANLPATYWNGTIPVNFPSFTDNTTDRAYNSYCNKLDGVTFALTGIYNSTDSVWSPGLMVPVNSTTTSTGNSRRSYASVSGIKSFYVTSTDDFLKSSRQESYQVLTALSGVTSAHLFGADRCKSVNGNTIAETAVNALDYLMSLDSIPKPKLDLGRRKF